MHIHPFDISPISRRFWEDKYQLRGPDGAPADATIEDSWRRVAAAAAEAERGRRAVKVRHEQTFFDAMSNFVFLPAGRILAGAGTRRDVTLFNCFVMGAIEDDLGSIFEHVREAAITMQKGGGIGHDFSTLRPNGARVESIGADASGPVSFMHVWDAMCRTIMSAGARRGAMMGTLRCDHPDIETFIEAKSDPAALRNFNVSVLVPDAFIEAVRGDRDWELVFGGQVFRTVKARALWARLMRATYEWAEPGVIFIDRVNARNNLNYCETIFATNPCGEQPLPPYGACLLGSINLARLVTKPFTDHADIDTASLEEHVRVAVRFLDNIIDVSNYPLAEQRREAEAKRRIGLGMTGLADALIFCGLDYDSDGGRERAKRWMTQIQNAAYLASAELAADRGAFPLYDADAFLSGAAGGRLEPAVRSAIEAHGIRNGCLTSIAPTGTISLIAGNVSSGIEPLFAVDYERRVLAADGSSRVEKVTDYAAMLWRTLKPGEALPGTFVTAESLSVDAHLRMQAVVQSHVDSSISKTINCPEDMTFDEFQDVYMKAYDLGLKGCTTFRPNAVTGAVLTGFSEPQATFSGPDAGDAGEVRKAAASVNDANTAWDLDAVRGLTATPAGRSSRLTDADDVIFMTAPLERSDVLLGRTYKLKWPASAHAMYVTINDIEQDGRQRPFEIFINTKNLDHQAWTVALTRMISAVFRRGGDVSFVVDELKAIFDPQGGQWVNGRYVPSLIAAIGDLIERHMLAIGFLGGGEQVAQSGTRARIGAGEFVGRARTPSPSPTQPAAVIDAGAAGGAGFAAGDGGLRGLNDDAGVMTGQPRGRWCPRCGNGHLNRIEGCLVCHDCGYSHCG